MAEASAPTAPYPPLQGQSLLFAALALSLATFMNVLDTTIANVSIPAISGDLGVSPAQGTWVITSFAVSNAIGVPLTGWLSTRFGAVRMFVTSVLMFVAASLLCALSRSLEMLLLFRVIQGLVAAPMIPLSLALLLQCFPREKSGMAMAAWAMTTLVAPVVGPILGGWLTDNLAWPWIFYINVPVGLLAAWGAWLSLHRRETPTHRVPIDYVGLGLLVLWVGALQIMFDKGRELDWFNSGLITFLGITALAGFAFFIAWELTERHPIVDLSLFRRRTFTMAVIPFSLSFALFFGNLVILPLWLQQTMGYTATWAGLLTAPIGILALILSPVVGRNLTRVDPRGIATIAFVTFGLTSLMRARFNTDIDAGVIVLPQFIQGIAMATYFVPLTAILLNGIPHEQVPLASGLSNFLRLTGGAFGTSIATTLWDDRTSAYHARLVEHITPYDATPAITIGNLNSAGFDAAQALGLVDRLVNTQAAMLAAADFFYIAGWLMFALIPLIWLAPIRQTATSPPASGEH